MLLLPNFQFLIGNRNRLTISPEYICIPGPWPQSLYCVVSRRTSSCVTWPSPRRRWATSSGARWARTCTSRKRSTVRATAPRSSPRYSGERCSHSLQSKTLGVNSGRRCCPSTRIKLPWWCILAASCRLNDCCVAFFNRSFFTNNKWDPTESFHLPDYDFVVCLSRRPVWCSCIVGIAWQMITSLRCTGPPRYTAPPLYDIIRFHDDVV